MKMNRAGLALIKKFEGFRSHAYKDAVGVWTIGYGHTSMAGHPLVTPGMKISRSKAEDILAKDVEKFSRKIRPMIKVKLNENQFSALVSFAYNVGPGGFARSSVLKRVNNSDFDAVPHRLALWVKAGGRTLRGLIRRRAAEGDLFLSRRAVKTSTGEHDVKPSQGKPARESTTVLAAIISAVTALFSRLIEHENTWSVFAVAGVLIILAASCWIIIERIKKSKHEGV